MEIVNFLKEFQRMCTSCKDCIYCPCSPEKCLVNSPIDMTKDELTQFIDIVKEWSKNHLVEIDWSKVPEDTPVYVCQNKADGEVRCYFKKYYPNHEKPFLCYSDGQTSWSSHGLDTTYWVHCELAREEDIKKYAKTEEK